MTPDRYQEFVRIGNFTNDERDAKFLVAMGLAGEAAEVGELTEEVLQNHLDAAALAIRAGRVGDRLKKHLLHHKPLDRDALVKELGDVAWYLFLSFEAFGVSFDEVAGANVVKLCKRYPDQYGKPEDWGVEATCEHCMGSGHHPGSVVSGEPCDACGGTGLKEGFTS